MSDSSDSSSDHCSDHKWLYIGGGIALLIIIMLGIWLYMRNKNNKETNKPMTY